MTDRIHPDTHMGLVALTVKDLARSIQFYTDRLGFHVRQQSGNTAYLGAGGTDLLRLDENPAARQVRGTTGLYHFAVLVPSRVELARSLARIIQTQTPVTGFADHNVSEAIYLPDPDNNGIEIYRDRPRSEWEYANGALKMGTAPLDLDSILDELTEENAAWNGLADGTAIGHMHLHVSTIPETEAFYQNVIGFDLIMRYGRMAAFLSAGGYHHHLGTNTWAGVGAPRPPADAVGLQWYTIVVPDTASLGAVADRARQQEVALEERDEGLFLRDPSGNGIIVTVD